MSIPRRHTHLVRLAVAYAADNADEFIIPDDLSALSDEDLASLREQATTNFDTVYGENGEGLTDDDFSVLAKLTEGIERLSAEEAVRAEAAEARVEAAAGLAARVRPTAPDESEEDAEGVVDEAEAIVEGAAAEENVDEHEGEPALVAASPIRVPMSAVRSRASRAAVQRATDAVQPETIRDVMFASGEGLGRPVGSGVNFAEAGEMLDRRLNTFNARAYASAGAAGRHVREQHSLVGLRRPIPADLTVRSNDPEHVRSVFDKAGDESRLQGGSLVASGGWCAPSEVLYDLVGEVESRDGLLSIPEIGVPRGGISFTTGIDFADLYTTVDNGAFSFTEAQDIAGEYAAGGTVGDKPCFELDCPEFEEHRLDVDGLCVTAGILQSRGFPEVQARSIRGVLVAHDHLMNGKLIDEMVTGSTAVTMPAVGGATGALLLAIELQVEHYKTIRRMSRNTSLEIVLPYWVLGVLRADLAQRAGVDLINVPDSRITAWFTQLGVRPQFVYNWQAISGVAEDFTAWPATVDFLLYTAGTWIRGAADIITLDTIYDSTLLGQNNFTALFTEEGWFVAKRTQDSRVVTVPLAGPGTTFCCV